jgi:hypothetical protein
MRSRIYGHGTGGKTGVGCTRASPRVGQYRAAGKGNGSVHLLLALVVGSAIILIGSCVRGATTMSTTRTSRGGAPVFRYERVGITSKRPGLYFYASTVCYDAITAMRKKASSCGIEIQYYLRCFTQRKRGTRIPCRPHSSK